MSPVFLASPVGLPASHPTNNKIKQIKSLYMPRLPHLNRHLPPAGLRMKLRSFLRRLHLPGPCLSRRKHALNVVPESVQGLWKSGLSRTWSATLSAANWRTPTLYLLLSAKAPSPPRRLREILGIISFPAHPSTGTASDNFLFASHSVTRTSRMGAYIDVLTVSTRSWTACAPSAGGFIMDISEMGSWMQTTSPMKAV